jgi:hypothetical protein
MSDSYISIVPRIKDYPNNEDKAKEILQWLVEIDIVKSDLSDCILGSENGFAISERAEDVVEEPQYLPSGLIVNGLEIATTSQVFHPGEFWDDENGDPSQLPESNLGFTFWNWPPFKKDFLKEFEQKLQCKIEVIIGRI